jgi:signal transduction histidine kinase
MTQLDQVTAAFGRGEFDARIKVPRRSALSTLASTFNGMAERIQRLIASHKELTNAVSHELRTPIARLRFGIEMLGNARDEATRSRFIASMNADIDELDSLVAELLAYARFDRQSPRLQLERQPLQSWLRDFVEEVQEETSAINLRCKFDPEGEPLSATFEPKLIARAIGNLLRNARRYAEDQVEIRVEINGQDLQICVDDDGPGVPVADRERVFEPFTRLDTSRDRSSGGYGLGLAIVKRIAEWHGGRAFVKDSPLGGASYCLRWPGSAE